ncbi:3-dehydroquinate synthase [Leadbettera azotonutricia]|uniref:3-dehydroquinate synthase n=1 Tax=Leadbettera azotonutricia (strain ATCC BAA-888 / DSM 13862 / ZAS-9) TaxID=545695 RepID=F5YAW4_LEAAZ|nr:3-dehydroquinate synthase family protein [Leadbettera azotonutricia]AEF82397.1 3-dehydroquinate synthase [Leadbettera azotonutricia ZAS-9]
MPKFTYNFNFGGQNSAVFIQDSLPGIEDLQNSGIHAPEDKSRRILLVCDANTQPIARKIQESSETLIPVCVLQSGETHKNWASAEAIIKAAREAGLGRDGLFVGIGGGVISDLTAFAASVYMRGAKLSLVSTTLLGMADAALGGKAGFDYLGIKNLVGTFYPASRVFMPLCSLETLPQREWKSGMAELIKTAILSDADFLNQIKTLKQGRENLDACIAKAVEFKGRIVEQDPKETGKMRALLNLGHTFGHALESAAGLGKISHGEAVAWGIARSCELGMELNITPQKRAAEIIALLNDFGYETRAPHPLNIPAEEMLKAMSSDKKKQNRTLAFIVPAPQGAEIAQIPDGSPLPKKIINRESQ